MEFKKTTLTTLDYLIIFAIVLSITFVLWILIVLLIRNSEKYLIEKLSGSCSYSE